MANSRADELKVKRREILSRLKNVENEIKALSSGLVSSDMVDIQSVQPSTEEKKRLESVRHRIVLEQKSIDAEIQSLEDRIRRLKFWLTIETVGGISTVALVKFGFGAASSIFGTGYIILWFLLPIAAAVAFLPYLLVTLIKLKKYSWIWILVIMVGVPGTLNFIQINDKYFTLAFQLLPLLMFFVYCGILRWIVDDWLEY